MKCTNRRPARGGSVLVIVIVLALILFAALFSLSFLTRTDASTTSNLIHELHATYLAESIMTQIDARVSTHPWGDRFWIVEAQKNGTPPGGLGVPPVYNFDAACPYLDLSQDTLDPGSYELAGIIKDLPTGRREYRLYLEITFEADTYRFCWDKEWDSSLLVGLNRGTPEVSKVLEDLAAGGSNRDDLLDSIKNTANAAPPPEGADPEQVARLIALDRDSSSFQATVIMPDPDAAPVVPKLPKGGGDKDGGDKGGGDGKKN